MLTLCGFYVCIVALLSISIVSVTSLVTESSGPIGA